MIARLLRSAAIASIAFGASFFGSDFAAFVFSLSLSLSLSLSNQSSRLGSSLGEFALADFSQNERVFTKWGRDSRYPWLGRDNSGARRVSECAATTPLPEFGYDDAAKVSAFHQLRTGLSLCSSGPSVNRNKGKGLDNESVAMA
jgi:hypothetical protein